MKVTVKQYPAHPERDIPGISYQYKGEEFILIEGVVALSNAMIRELARYKIFVDIDRKAHKKRIEEFYLWRGKTPDEIEKLYSQRFEDEYQLIEKERKFADLILNSIAT